MKTPIRYAGGKSKAYKIISEYIPRLPYPSKIISPFIPKRCRYTPTCSQYMIEAIREWGFFKGLLLGFKRLIRCQPWGGQGFDSVPNKNQK